MTNNKLTFFQWILCFLGMLILQEKSFAQLSEGGIPPSFQFQTALRSRQATVQIPVTFNAKDLRMVDERQAQGTPLAVAKQIDVHYNPTNAGVWSTLPDRTVIWQFHLQAKGAIALMIYYSDFYIPEGGKLFLYNAYKTQILGAYTQHTHPTGGRFATEFVAGDELTFEYVAAPNREMPRIEIEAIGYGYNHLTVQNSSVSLRRSGSCEVNINCEEGDAWQNQKKGVCYMTQRINNRTYLCTGSLVNNTAQDLKPYILTAQHCECNDKLDVVATPEDMEQWVFYFHHERQECSNNSPLEMQKTMVGCKRVAATSINYESDGLLVLLKMAVPANYNVYYNGWDRRNQPAQSGVSIHHPVGDYKKISTFNTPAIHYTLKTGDGIIGDTNAHWNVTFDASPNGHGVTEDGSSGGPLFNENKLIVGTLSGGNSTCSKTDGLNIYGKVSYHWDKYKYSDTTRLDIWLDPGRSGVEFLAGRYHHAIEYKAPTIVSVTYTTSQHIAVLWDPPVYDQTLFSRPTGYHIYRDNIKIATVPPEPRRYLDDTPSHETFYQVSAFYGVDEGLRSESVSIKPVKSAPWLYPGIFENQVELVGYEYINRVEVYSATGQLFIRIDNPEQIIRTESLHSGVYFFRIYMDNNKTVNVVKGVKR